MRRRVLGNAREPSSFVHLSSVPDRVRWSMWSLPLGLRHDATAVAQAKRTEVRKGSPIMWRARRNMGSSIQVHRCHVGLVHVYVFRYLIQTAVPLTVVPLGGGCVKASPFGSPSTSGVNCHDIPNVDEVSCKDSQCFVHTCKSGFTTSSANDGCIARPHEERS